MTSLAAAGVVVVVEADDSLLEADDFELASDGPGASDPRHPTTYRDLTPQGSGSMQTSAMEQRLESKPSKGSTMLYVKTYSYCNLSQRWACATLNVRVWCFRPKWISAPEKLWSSQL